jgi:hypothetical protein
MWLEKIVFKHVATTQWLDKYEAKKEEMPGMLQSLTLIFSFYTRVQISVSLGEVV